MRFLKATATALALLLPAAATAAATTEKPAEKPAASQRQNADDRQQFLAANVFWILYHELGHALIHQMDLPVLGKEEDAADQLAIFLTDELWDDEQADIISDLVASAFWQAGEQADEPAPWWDEHSTDQQRHFTVACLYYAGDPDRRGHVLNAVGLPEDRAEMCLVDRDQVDRAWGGVLDELSTRKLPGKLRFKGPDSADATQSFLATVLEDEVAFLNDEITLPADLTVTFTPCGEENAFYDPETSEIQICAEFSDFMDRLHKP